jgi:cysteinyl-tRNA synthetase
MSTHPPLSLKLYNTLTQQVEPFEPQDCLEPGKVRMYVCGPTVYDDAHLGHARCYITWDVLYRFLAFAGYDVTYVRNVTDVDDKILKRAAERGITPKALSEQYYESFLQDMDALNVLRPNHEPKAMDYIQQMLEGIQVLIDKGAAYVTPEGTVYYDTASKADYGKLSKKPLDDLLAGARVDVDPHKKNPTDFALWKHVNDSDTTVWETPWGKGRPGWHMECSAMSRSILGDQIDIHCGGSDLIFPHHENEIAQSEAWTGKEPFVRVWMHNGFVNVSGEKMSKSLGNFATVKTTLARYNANTIRYFLLTNHYRMPVDFNEEALQSAENRVEKIHRFLRQFTESNNICLAEIEEKIAKKYSDLGQVHLSVAEDVNNLNIASFFTVSLENDLNTPQALAHLNELINRLKGTDKKTLFFLIMSYWIVLGFSITPIFEFKTHSLAKDIIQPLLQKWEIDLSAPINESDEILVMLIERRKKAKTNKEWATCDGIRDDLKAIGVTLMDNKDGTTTWEYKPVQDTQPVG